MVSLFLLTAIVCKAPTYDKECRPARMMIAGEVLEDCQAMAKTAQAEFDPSKHKFKIVDFRCHETGQKVPKSALPK